ncbi:MAG: YchF/TatD family DNA exonuclease [Candidatus Omnitrophica bacterium]|nr:YchF/TatD family DNA exonuclease [Candidatus Omnitrophota bacterium]
MKLVDTHCHLDLPDYNGDLSEVLVRAGNAGVERIVVPGIDLNSSRKAVRLAAREPMLFSAIGIHPHEADKAKDEDIASLRELAVSEDKIVAVGEIGIDLYKGYSDPAAQKKLLVKLIEMALELDLPMIFHSREAAGELLEIIERYDHYATRAVLHCFAGEQKHLEGFLAKGFYVSFAGNITYAKASAIRDLAKKVPIEQLLLETDSPYLSPSEVRGKRNEPANVRSLPAVLAGTHGLSPEDVGRITSHNANSLFKLGLERANIYSYPIRDSLYLNVTSRCTNRCSFCTRDISDYVKGHNLRLDKEPTAEEVINSMGDIDRYKDVVFCGFGEPTLRLGLVKKTAAFARSRGKKVRLVTNGEGDLIASRPIAKELASLVDLVSVSLNSPDEAGYDHICRSVFGERAYPGILAFLESCRDNGIKTEVTCLDLIGQEAVKAVKEKAVSLGATFRERHTDVVG